MKKLEDENNIGIFKEIDVDKTYEEIKEIIEIYETSQYRLNDSNLKKVLKIVAEFIKKINDNNFYDYYCQIPKSNIGLFWEIFEKFKIYENISKEKFKELLYNLDTMLCEILEYKNIVKYYDEIIAENMRKSNQSARIIVSKYLEKNEKKLYHFPCNLKSHDLAEILEDYIESDCANIAILKLLIISQSTSECPISDKLRLNAKRKVKNYLEDPERKSLRISYRIETYFKNYDKIIDFKEVELRKYQSIYDIKWIEENLDFPTLLNNFIYLFEFTDRFGRSNFPAIETRLNILEKIMGLKGKREYEIGSEFLIKDIKFSSDIREYSLILNSRGIRIESIIEWFFKNYLIEEFGVRGFVFKEPSEGTSFVEKCKILSSEMDGILKQFKMYAENKELDRELFEMSSNSVKIETIPSMIKNKYLYVKSKEVKKEQNLLFSDQSTLLYLSETEESFENFFDLLTKRIVNIDNYSDYDKENIKFLENRENLKIESDGTININIIKSSLLKDLYNHDVICSLYYEEYKEIIEKLVKSGDLEYADTLFSKPEQNYLNFVLNKSKYSNGMDLRNKYIHSTYPINHEIQELDYYYLLRVMIMVIIKINEEFCFENKNINY